MNLYEKLVKIRQSVSSIAKNARNHFHNYDYASHEAVVSALKPMMDELGVLLVSRVKSQEILDRTIGKDGKTLITMVKIEFVWINAEKPEEREVCEWAGQGSDSSDKGLWKALTGAEKYFLLRFFNIPTDKDDPDYSQQQTRQTQQQTRRDVPQQQKQERREPQKSATIEEWEQKYIPDSWLPVELRGRKITFKQGATDATIKFNAANGVQKLRQFISYSWPKGDDSQKRASEILRKRYPTQKQEVTPDEEARIEAQAEAAFNADNGGVDQYAINMAHETGK